MHPLAEALASQFIGDFWAANHEIEWLAVEEERHLWLDTDTVLVGRVDARGRTSDGDLFFGEWKSAGASKARRMAEVKATWRRDPQALTYGVLLGGETRRFTVRWALKTPRPTTDFEWYTYTHDEIIHWRVQLMEIADEIRAWRAAQNVTWRTNFGNCYRYGIKYACPFVAECPFTETPGSPRIPHLQEEANIKANWKLDNAFSLSDELVVLDASRVGDYLACPESYRRKWEGAGFQEQNENLTIGSDMHTLIASHLRSLIKEPSNA